VSGARPESNPTARDYGWAGVPDEASFRRTVHEQAVTQLRELLSEREREQF
jgi:hypothetical protein